MMCSGVELAAVHGYQSWFEGVIGGYLKLYVEGVRELGM